MTVCTTCMAYAALPRAFIFMIWVSQQQSPRGSRQQRANPRTFSSVMKIFMFILKVEELLLVGHRHGAPLASLTIGMR